MSSRNGRQEPEGLDAAVIGAATRVIEAQIEFVALQDEHIRIGAKYGIRSPAATVAEISALAQGGAVKAMSDALEPMRAVTMDGMEAKARALLARWDMPGAEITALLRSWQADLRNRPHRSD